MFLYRFELCCTQYISLVGDKSLRQFSFLFFFFPTAFLPFGRHTVVGSVQSKPNREVAAQLAHVSLWKVARCGKFEIHFGNTRSSDDRPAALRNQRGKSRIL